MPTSIVDILKNSPLTSYRIAKDTGISEATIGNYRKGKTIPTMANAKILAEYFNNTSIDLGTSQEMPTTSVITVKSEQTMPELPIIPKALTEQSDFDIWPVIQEEKSNFEKFNLLQALRDIDFVYKVEEDVLSPHINIGDYLFLKRVTGHMKIINGTCYLLDTAYYNVILRYVYDDGDCYKLKTPNRPYSEVSIPKDKVYGTYIIKGKYTSHITTPDNTAKQLKMQTQQISSLVNSVGSLIDITTSSSKRTDKLIDMLQTEIDKHHQ